MNEKYLTCLEFFSKNSEKKVQFWKELFLSLSIGWFNSLDSEDENFNEWIIIFSQGLLKILIYFFTEAHSNMLIYFQLKIKSEKLKNYSK